MVDKIEIADVPNVPHRHAKCLLAEVEVARASDFGESESSLWLGWQPLGIAC